MKITKDLLQIWDTYIRDGLMKNTFENQTGKFEAGLRSPGCEQYIIELATGKNVCEPPRFERLANGIDILFNPFGALKPTASIGKPGKQKDLSEGVAACAFACGTPDNALSLLKRPSLSRITFTQSDWLVFPNVTPWEPRGLFLWVQAPNDSSRILPHQSQVLTLSTLTDFLEIASYNKNVATFFNSEHGGASANHLHFQSSYWDHSLAVENAERESMGAYTVTKNYPAPALVFPTTTSPEILWHTIDRIQLAELPFNLVALPSGLYIFIRNSDQEIPDELPGRGISGINLAGLFITSNKIDFSTIADTEKIIFSAYTKTTLDPRCLAIFKP